MMVLPVLEKSGVDFHAPQVGFEPTTGRLTADYSAIELPGNDKRLVFRAIALFIVRSQFGLADSEGFEPSPSRVTTLRAAS